MTNTIIAIFTLFFVYSTAHAEILIGKVVGVADGDTITVLDKDKTQYKIRLAGIDAPEKKQPFGQASKKMLSNLIFGQTVEVDWHKRDRYGRLIGKVIFDGVDINLEQIKNGLAWFYHLIFKSNNENYFILKINGFHSSKKLMLNLVEGFIIHRISVQPN